jgi:hypothetical protein
MSSSDLMILVIMTVAAMTLVTLWRKVLLLMLSVAIAVFFYGLINLTHLIHP